MTEGYETQRRFPRVPSENTLLVKKLGVEPSEGFAKTRVVGLGGCMFVSDEALGVGSHLELLMAVRGEVVPCECRVVYENALGRRQFEVGVEFVGIREEDREALELLFPPDAASPSDG